MGIPTACILWCWNNEPTMVSTTMVDGICNVLSSSAVNLKTNYTMNVNQQCVPSAQRT
jgi:hypothetical protein